MMLKRLYSTWLNKFNFFFSSESEDEKQSDKHSANNKVNKSRKVKHSTVAVTPSESQYKRKGNSTGMSSLARSVKATTCCHDYGRSK